MNRYPFALTKHAKLRRKQMGVSEDRIARVLADPDMTLPQPLGQEDSGIDARHYVKDGIRVVAGEAEDGSMLVLTVLYDSREEYLRPEAMAS